MSDNPYLKLYIAVLNTVPDHMVPVLVAHTMLNAHCDYLNDEKWPVDTGYKRWLWGSFRKCVVSVNDKEFEKISQLHPNVHLGHENTTLAGKKSCAIPLPVWSDKVPNVLSYAKLWSPK